MKYKKNSMISYAKILSPLILELKSKYPIKHIALFGSVTREDFDPQRSDIDIMVDFTGEDVLEFIALAEELEKITGRKVDLLSKRSLKPRQLEYLEKEFIYV